jgi:hypothetical protein
VAPRSKAWVCGRSLGGIAGANTFGVVFVPCEFVLCQVEVTATGRSLVQRSPTECDREASIIRRPWPTRCCCIMGENSNQYLKVSCGLCTDVTHDVINPPRRGIHPNHLLTYSMEQSPS